MNMSEIQFMSIPYEIFAINVSSIKNNTVKGSALLRNLYWKTSILFGWKAIKHSSKHEVSTEPNNCKIYLHGIEIAFGKNVKTTPYAIRNIIIRKIKCDTSWTKKIENILNSM